MKLLDKAIKLIDRNYRGTKKISIYLEDGDNNLENLLNEIKKQSGNGHCLRITLDQGKESNQNFCFDGDGTDMIYDIEVETEVK